MGYEKIIDGIYHVGDPLSKNGLDCNPYVLVDGEEVIVFDPGSIIEFDVVVENIKSLIPLEKITYVVIHHQDADIVSSVPLYEQLGLDFQIITSWRCMTLIQYYGVQSPYYLLEEHNYELILKSGRRLKFIQTPYLHFPGAFVTYDYKTKTLFSSDLFGAFSYNHTLYADENYMDKMLTFHEHYMPSNSVLRPVMDVLMSHEINRIMPQHGSIILNDVKKYIEALRTLECGSLLAPLKKDLKESGGFLMIFNDVLHRYLSLYDHDDVIFLFKGIKSFQFDSENRINDYEGDPTHIWHQMFECVKNSKGMLWITVIEPHVRNLCAIYDIPMPNAMSSLLQSAQMENLRLLEMNKSLEQTVKAVNERLIQCPVTGLYNETFVKSLLIEELNNEDWRDIGAFATLAIDDFSKYKLSYGAKEEENVLNNITYLLKERFGDNAVYRMDSSDFALYIKGLEKEMIINDLEELRVSIAKSNLFIGHLTISIGLSFHNELKLDDATFDMTAKNYMELSLTRLRIAKVRGKNYLCYEGESYETSLKEDAVLIVDHDETNIDVIKTFLEEAHIKVYTAGDGYLALEKAEIYLPAVIISEVNLPKMDGFLLREQLMANSKTKDVEVIYLSHLKDEQSVRRASELNVTHYLRKPYLLSELTGIVKRAIKG